VFAFDENNKLVTSVTQEGVNLSRDFEVLLPVSDGNYTFVAWAGVDDHSPKERSPTVPIMRQSTV